MCLANSTILGRGGSLRVLLQYWEGRVYICLANRYERYNIGGGGGLHALVQYWVEVSLDDIGTVLHIFIGHSNIYQY